MTLHLFPNFAAASRRSLLFGLGTLGILGAQAYELDVVHDFGGVGQPGYNYVDEFYDAPLVIGTGANTTLWFTAQKGGLDDEGDLVSYHLSSNTLTVQGLNFGGATQVSPGVFVNDPARPEASPVYDNGDGTKNHLYFTTVGGGFTGNASGGGTLVRYDMDANTYEMLWQAPAAASGGLRQPRGAVAIVDRGGQGKDIYFTASGAGAAPGTSSGGILRYNTATGVTSVVKDFNGAPNDGGMPYDGFVQVGDKLYLTTFAGGTGPATGSGTLGVIDISDPESPTYQTLANLPGTATSGDGSSARLPASTPIFDPQSNALYFTTIGSNGNPGNLMKFSLDSTSLISLYELPAGAASGPNLEGRQGGYNSPFLYDEKIFYVTRNGGANNLGAINVFDLATGTNQVLFSLTTETGGTVYSDFGFSDFDFNGDGVLDPSLYFTTSAGGENGMGTILRLSLVPEPSSAVLGLLGVAVVFARSRRARGAC